MAPNNLTLEQKSLTITYAMSLVEEGHPQWMTILEDAMADLGITKEQIKHMEPDNFEPEALKSLSPSDKKVVQRTLTKNIQQRWVRQQHRHEDCF